MYKELPISLEMNNSEELLIGHIAVSVTNKQASGLAAVRPTISFSFIPPKSPSQSKEFNSFLICLY